MQNKLNPIIQAILLIILPVIVVIIINYILAISGKESINSLTANTLRISLLLIPNTLYIILHKYKLSYLSFIVAIAATFIAMNSISAIQFAELSSFTLFVFNFIYFSLFIGVTYFSYFVIKGFKLKNIVFILCGIISHTISFLGLFLINKQPINLELVRVIMHTGANTYLMVGLALAIGILFFELPEPKKELEYGYYDDDDDN